MLEEINRAVSEVFLGGRFESRPLYLVLDNQGREQLATSLNVGPHEVEDVCCREVSKHLKKQGDPYSNFEYELFAWSLRRRKGYPPFTALLFVLSHAAEQMVSDGQFTAGNYYDRLSALVNVAPGRLSQHGRSTEQFWKSFNSWLADNDFAFGRPTARAINSNRYVGIPMSQAIVREADRQRFHLMFDKYGFTNTDDVSETEIEQYISTWIRSTQPTKQLKEAWKKTELRSRICEAAIAELEDWQAEDTATSGSSGSGISRLSLALGLRHDFLGRSAALYFGKEQSLESIALGMDGSGELELSNTTYAAFATLEPRSSIPLSRCLLHGLELDQDGEPAYKWHGRPAIPLSRSDQGYWSEVSRVSLGVEHLVLVRDDSKIRGAIEGALEEAAAPGYTLATPAQLKGLPPGWVLYEKVVIKRALSELKGFESVLSPVGEAASLRLEGGIKLGRGIYHRWLPPTVQLESTKPGVSVVAWEGSSPDGPELCSQESGSSAVELDLSDCIPESGNVYLEGRAGKTPVASASLLFRSADRPRPLDRQARSIVEYTGVQQAIVGRTDSTIAVRGLLIRKPGTGDYDLGILDSFRDLPAPPQRLDENEEAGPGAPVVARSSEAIESIKGLSVDEVMELPCAVRGLHRLKFAPVPPGTPQYAPVDVECLDCDITYLHRRKPAAKAGARRSSARRSVPQSSNVGSSIAKREINHDLWLDGACFLGAGSAAVFETFAASSGVDPWRAGPVLRDFTLLGHLDVETGPTHRARNWSASPPVLSHTGNGTAVLSGFRSKSLIEQLHENVVKAGGELQLESLANHPSIVRVFGLDEEALAEAIGEVRDPHGRTIAVVSNAGPDILSFLADRASLVEMFRPVSLGKGIPVQRYDPHFNKWRNADQVQGQGAYRVSEAGTSYVYVTASGKAFSGPHELVKVAAARGSGTRLHAYDPETRQFSSRLGCEPIGLLGRALVSCRGQLPPTNDGLSIFKDVPPGVAAGVLHHLYNGELPG
ncbi:hypothetical protein PF049_12345 [Erythrobacteraceae bacterium WH01K]|nr:hypothetical protein PF049_12345 [Erythrobacteraceae bacterium WH01K]